VETDEGEHKTLEILDQVVETPAKEYKTKIIFRNFKFLCEN
jgi:hypothetical protein